MWKTKNTRKRNSLRPGAGALKSTRKVRKALGVSDKEFLWGIELMNRKGIPHATAGKYLRKELRRLHVKNEK